MDWHQRSMRRPVINEPGQAHELTFCCYKRYPFLKVERTCEWLSQAVNKARGELNCALWSYVFMPEHVHLLIHPKQPDYDISTILKKIKEPVGRKAVKHLRVHATDWLARIAVPRGELVEYRF